MLEKIARKVKLTDFSEIKDNLAYWLSKTPEERIEAVELLRRERHGSIEGFQRTVRVVRLNEADIEAISEE